MPDQLAHDLVQLGRSVPTPDAAALEQAVMARITESTSHQPAFIARTAVRGVAAAIAVLLALLAAPPVRAAIADWFGFGSVVVHRGSDEPSGDPVPPAVGSGTSFAGAAARMGFEVYRLPALGPATAAEVSPDGRVLSVGWEGGIRVDQSSSLEYTFEKTTDSVQRVLVAGQEALWFPDSHEVILLDRTGARIPDTRRTAGRTLIWTLGDTTLRLEGDLTLDRALQIAESSERLG